MKPSRSETPRVTRGIFMKQQWTARLGMETSRWGVSVTQVGGWGWAMERPNLLNTLVRHANFVVALQVMIPPHQASMRRTALGNLKPQESLAELERMEISVITNALAAGNAITRRGSANVLQVWKAQIVVVWSIERGIRRVLRPHTTGPGG
jgi:hypothetical protein